MLHNKLNIQEDLKVDLFENYEDYIKNIYPERYGRELKTKSKEAMELDLPKRRLSQHKKEQIKELIQNHVS